jgi:acid phosphatase (class A)
LTIDTSYYTAAGIFGVIYMFPTDYNEFKYMKKRILFSLMAMVAITAISQPRAPKRETYLDISEVANSIELLPPPPAYGSFQFANDSTWYEWGKAQRDTPRGDLAATDADIHAADVAAAMSEAFGTEISPEKTPELYKLLATMREDAGDLSTRLAKNYYQRERPYVHFQEPTCRPEEDARLSSNGSYPSGHTAIGWAIALVLAEINPANQVAILKRGYEMGESRIICGFHYRSDVDAGRIVGAAVVARLHANDAFMEQLSKAKKEVAEILRLKDC